jgi:hypothetical protein
VQQAVTLRIFWDQVEIADGRDGASPPGSGALAREHDHPGRTQLLQQWQTLVNAQLPVGRLPR